MKIFGKVIEWVIKTIVSVVALTAIGLLLWSQLFVMVTGHCDPGICVR